MHSMFYGVEFVFQVRTGIAIMDANG